MYTYTFFWATQLQFSVLCSSETLSLINTSCLMLCTMPESTCKSVHISSARMRCPSASNDNSTKRPSRDKTQRSRSSNLQHQHQQNLTQHSTPYRKHTRNRIQTLRNLGQSSLNSVWTKNWRTKSKVHIHPELYEYKSLLTHYRCARFPPPDPTET